MASTKCVSTLHFLQTPISDGVDSKRIPIVRSMAAVVLVPKAGLEPARLAAGDFESPASTYSATRARVLFSSLLVCVVGFEPTVSRVRGEWINQIFPHTDDIVQAKLRVSAKRLSKNGRCERIRTFDPLHPMQVRYQAALHTELTLLRLCWCPRPDSNRHAVKQRLLGPSCLPFHH